MRHESLMLDLGGPAPSFTLSDPHGTLYSLEDFSASPALLVAFICNHCPFVQHLLTVFVQLAAEYKEKGLATVAISSNDVEAFPEDGPEFMASLAKEHSFTFPYLYDPAQTAALDFGAACTPDFFLYDQTRKLAYRGRFDASKPTTEHVQGNALKPDGSDVRRAIDAVLAGKAVPGNQIAAIGCSMKWKPGNQPVWG